MGAVLTSRRSPGLRREELAGLAGISMDYLVQLEQGRAAHPSAPVVAALGRALRLGPEDTALLHVAAGLAPPTSSVDRTVPPSMDRLLARVQDRPAAVYSADWWLLRWNRPWAALLGDPAAHLGRSRNLVWHEMTGHSPRVHTDSEEHGIFRDALVGDLHVAQVAHPEDPELIDLIGALHAASPEFTDRWRAARPVLYRGARKQVDHPDVGVMTLDSDIFLSPGAEARLIVYSAAPGTPDASRLQLLAVIADETFAH